MLTDIQWGPMGEPDAKGRQDILLQHRIHHVSSKQEYDFKTWFYRLERGVYVCGLNLNFIVDMLSTQKEVHDYKSREFNANYGYGVADNLSQIKERFAKYWTVPDRQFFLALTIMRKNEMDSEGGWRWHKWGEYIGTQEPQCEYLYDEPVIKRAVCFHFHEVEKRTMNENVCGESRQVRSG
jgi:hypothetical protein